MFALLALPMEILDIIVANLAASQEDFDDLDCWYTPDPSLYRLALTCTTLRDICLPRLYEIINFRRCAGGLSLLRTLATSPEVASYVKRIIFDASFNLMHPTDDGVVLSEDDVALYNDILEESVDMRTVERLPGPIRGTDSLEREVANGIGSPINMPNQDWHTWRVEVDLRSGNWPDQSITWYMDGQQFQRITGSRINNFNVWHAVAQSPLYFILNVAVGGNWPGNPNSATLDGYGSMMEVAYTAQYVSQ
ncbi:hypothetical protein NQ176_g1777 [Zarea fungicola]|uniref:Uncharacterized protein n=1 Tax=Zarea fungicola TaxID=93591 RepID=A0ACC1NRU6_9HYPO|nr:hypothetical protein NQ176_g1777 [Lecanicillium fungicola]